MSRSNKSYKSIIIMMADRTTNVYGPEQMDEILRYSDLVAPPMTAEQTLAFPEVLNEVEVIFGGWGMPELNEEFLNHAPNLKAVFYAAGTVKAFATEAFWERGLVLSNAQHANAIPVAEYCLATILFSLKRGWYNMRRIREEKVWARDNAINGAYGSTVGLISMGTVARLTLGFLKPFNVKTLVNCVSLTEHEAAGLNVELSSLEGLFKRSDVVSLHTPALPETMGMIHGDHFRMMKENATFINTARGVVVNQEEMVEALKDRPDLTVVLDVLDPEPPEVSDELLQLPNVFLTPHIAGSQGTECRRLGQSSIDEYKRFASGLPLIHDIALGDLRSMA